MPKDFDTNESYPRRYNTLRLLGHDYADATRWYFITLCTRDRNPVLADFALAKRILTV